jgi:Pyridine nucleotide-disulphide oxidoreductase
VTTAPEASWDCIIVGAGPAGLNAALVLGRARWRALVLDDGSPRNYATHAMHGVLGHDGLDPAELRARGRAELSRYGVEVAPAEVDGARVLDGTVQITSRGRTELTRTVLLATGMLDELPTCPASPTCGEQARTPVPTATASSTATSDSPPRRRRPRRAPGDAPPPVVRRRHPAQQRPTQPRRTGIARASLMNACSPSAAPILPLAASSLSAWTRIELVS